MRTVAAPQGTIDRAGEGKHSGLRVEAGAADDAVELLWVSDEVPGIRRRRAGRAFRYLDPAGSPVHDDATLARIRGLVIPPAWQDVWICLDPSGHLQATGRDARGRKQYRYHPAWLARQEAQKFDRLLPFARALPALRERVHRDLLSRGLPRQKVVASVVSLLERTLIRVGNEEYARVNLSFGLTTLRHKHAVVNGSEVQFFFKGKGGQEIRIGLRDRRLASVVGRCNELPGQRLFQYLDESGDRQKIDSADVNAYIRDGTGGEFTAKDFRTWAATVMVAQSLSGLPEPGSVRERRRQENVAIDRAARRLGNTRAVCRRSYVHPGILDLFAHGELARVPMDADRLPTDVDEGLSTAERAVVRALRRWERMEGASGPAAS